jgi:hypothetical protein
VILVKALAELAAMFLFGRGILYLLTGAHRSTNLFYQVISIVTAPVIRAARWITPRFVVDAHIPMVAFMLVAWIWLAIVFWILPEMCGSGRYDCTSLLQRKGAG